eukprot:1645518-Ditylum_brightwellii.AAC.1
MKVMWDYQGFLQFRVHHKEGQTRAISPQHGRVVSSWDQGLPPRSCALTSTTVWSSSKGGKATSKDNYQQSG